MTESQLMQEIEKLVDATKDELAKKHHELYPNERASIRGAYNPGRKELLVDLIMDLIHRYVH